MRRVLPMGAVALAAALLLGGCGLLTGGPTAPPATEAPSGPPAGWDTFTHCDGAPENPWVWVDGFPADAFDSTGAKVDCGDTWPEDDGNTFVNITAYNMTLDELNAFGTALEAAGYQKLFDDFDPEKPSGEAYFGARDYYLDGVSDGDFTRVAIEIYPTVAGTDAWTAYIDYLSPETRKL